MLRHTGQRRSFKHDLRLAILLCLNAGFINTAGYLAFSVLTTNVTGHAALLAIDLVSLNFRSAQMVALWLFLFLAGAVFSGLYISIKGSGKAIAYSMPILIIIGIILFVIGFGNSYDHSPIQTEYFAGALLFAMGMQNSLVTLISGSVVRTTHLTGMFTDLGIDLSTALLSFRSLNKAIRRRIFLKLSIIGSFLFGGLAGGVMFLKFTFTSFYVPVVLLLLALVYDYFRVKFLRAIAIHKQPANRHTST